MLVNVSGTRHAAGQRAPQGENGQILRVRALGAPYAELAGLPVDGWRQTKSLTLLYYLLDRSNRMVDRATLLETFWPDGNGRAPETSLKVAIHGLRRLLSSAIPAGHCWAMNIKTHGSSYMLTTRGVWYDVAEFERSVGAATQLDYKGAPQEADSHYWNAGRLYRGDFLTGAHGDWTLRRRQSLVDQYLNVLISLAERDLAAGMYHRCVSHCLKALDSEPCCERAYQIIMRSHANAGQVERVFQWYSLCVQTLRHRLDIRPSQETERLFRQLAAPRL
jgi:DNA-binding SARP family transcriptional activator